MEFILSTSYDAYIRTVLRYDDFVNNLYNYLYNAILILFVFNTFYNSFGASVYFAEKFFLKNHYFEQNIIKAIQIKISKLNYLN